MTEAELVQKETAKFKGPVVDKDPRRMSIHGVTDTIAGLKKTIGEIEMHAGLKSYILDELDKISDTGAELHLHDIERMENGKVTGFNLHVSAVHRTIGAKPHMVFTRGS